MPYSPGPTMQIAIASLREAAAKHPAFARQLTAAADALAVGKKPDGAALTFARNHLSAASRYWAQAEMWTGRGHYLRPKMIREADPAKAAALARVLARLEVE